MFRRNVGRLKLVGVRLTFYPSRGHSEAVMGIFVDFFHFGPNFNPDAAPLALIPAPPIVGSRVFFCESHKIRGCYISKSKNRALSRTYWTYKIVKYCNLTWDAWFKRNSMILFITLDKRFMHRWKDN